MTPAPPRFHYMRWHSHPLGWAVRDSKHDCIVALGDKNVCAMIAGHLNDVPELLDGLLVNWAVHWDTAIAAGAPVWRPETD